MKSDKNMEDSSTNFDSNHGSNQETRSSFSFFENFPEELSQNVFSYCTLAKDRLNLMQVSGRFASSVAALEAYEYPKPKYVGMAGGNDYSFALTEDGRIFGCGQNGEGQLGHGDQQKIDVFTEIPGLKKHHFIQIATFIRDSLALTKDGRIFGCGDNEHGQLGQGDQQKRAVFTEIPGLKEHHFIQIAAGNKHSLALTKEGKIFSCGDNQCGQLGQGDEQKRGVFTEIPGLKEHHFIQIAAGAASNLALTKEGKIFSCGNNAFAQLGQGDRQNRAVFTEVPGLEGQCFTQIVMLGFHSLALTKEGKIFSCGFNCNGQLGQGDKQDRVIFTEVPGLEGQCFTQIAANLLHSLALSKTGKVFSCGNGSDGALGLGLLEGENKAQLTFKEVEGLKDKIIGIASGSRHSMVLTEEGQLFICGYNEKGELGLGSTENQTTFQPVPNFRPLKLPEKLKVPAI